MVNPRKFSQSTRHAVQGLKSIARHEQSFRLQLAFAVLVVVLSLVLPLATWERIIVYLLTAGVLVLEVLNSILERLADAVSPRLHPMVKEIKDMMAGAVLLVSLVAAIVGALIFIPHLVVLVRAMVY